MKTRTVTIRTEEQGFASIVIAIVMVLVLSLVTVGFAQLMRREEKSALDKQLSSQAYYAAESGINDATKAINDGYLGAKTGCGPGQGVDNNPAYAAGLADLNSNVVGYGSNPTGATYPCLLINPTPKDLHYDPINATQSRTLEFTALDSTGAAAAVDSIKISWQDAGTNTQFKPGDCTNDFPTTANWPYIGVLRAQVIPLDSAHLDRTTLSNSAFTAFMCPRASGGVTPGTANYGSSIGPANAGIIVNGNCNTSAQPQYCNVVLSNLPPNQATFFVNLRSIYSPTAVTITAFNGSTQLRLKGAQTLIDSTGKAQDVLRRIQVRVASTNGYDIPDGVHADICKQFDLDPSATTSNGTGCNLSDLTL
jgi:hypothetical protein